MDLILEIKNLIKHYGPVKAVDDITFSVEEGHHSYYIKEDSRNA